MSEVYEKDISLILEIRELLEKSDIAEPGGACNVNRLGL